MQIKAEDFEAEQGGRKPWVEPEFEVLGAEEAQNGAGPTFDGSNYS